MYQNEKLVPTANVAINKSRIKVYDKDSTQPIYYLNDGTEFQIELFNPTQTNVLCKISIDGKLISQTGLILRPGERIFLDRYIDVAKKFKFSTYEVSNTKEVQNAIKNNGGLKVEFFEEHNEVDFKILLNEIAPLRTQPCNPNINPWDTTLPSIPYIGDIYYNTSIGGTGISNGDVTTTTYNSDGQYSITTSNLGYNNFDGISTGTIKGSKDLELKSKRNFKKTLKSSKKIETGQVEKGSISDQTFESVNKTFSVFPFHTVEYKLLPTSQKNLTTRDVFRKYCGSCGSKVGKTDNFCSICGKEL